MLGFIGILVESTKLGFASIEIDRAALVGMDLDIAGTSRVEKGTSAWAAVADRESRPAPQAENKIERISRPRKNVSCLSPRSRRVEPVQIGLKRSGFAGGSNSRVGWSIMSKTTSKFSPEV